MSHARWLMTARLPATDLAAAALQGHPGALDDLARAWLPHVYRWCHRLGGPGFDAEDAAHETLIVMCRKIGRLGTPEQFPSWLFQTTRRVLANHRRRAWLRRWIPGVPRERASLEPALDEQMMARQAAEQVWAALERLSQEQREVLVLCELEERTGTEAALLLGVPLGTVKSRLRRAREAFRSQLEDAQPQAGVSRVVKVG